MNAMILIPTLISQWSILNEMKKSFLQSLETQYPLNIQYFPLWITAQYPWKENVHNSTQSPSALYKKFDPSGHFVKNAASKWREILFHDSLTSHWWNVHLSKPQGVLKCETDAYISYLSPRGKQLKSPNINLGLTIWRVMLWWWSGLCLYQDTTKL